MTSYVGTLSYDLLHEPARWDLPPEVGVVYAPDGPERPFVTRPLTGLPPELWNAVRVPDVLVALSDLLANHSDPEQDAAMARLLRTHPGWCGVYVRYEMSIAPSYVPELRMLTIAFTRPGGMRIAMLNRSDNTFTVISGRVPGNPLNDLVIASVQGLLATLAQFYELPEPSHRG